MSSVWNCKCGSSNHSAMLNCPNCGASKEMVLRNTQGMISLGNIWGVQPDHVNKIFRVRIEIKLPNNQLMIIHPASSKIKELCQIIKKFEDEGYTPIEIAQTKEVD